MGILSIAARTLFNLFVIHSSTLCRFWSEASCVSMVCQNRLSKTLQNRL
jgi:hypothetical protein